MGAELWRYTRAIAHHWEPLATGIAAMVVSLMVGYFYGEHAPVWLWVAIVLTSIFIASFLAWREVQSDKDKCDERIRDLTTSKLSIKFNPSVSIGPLEVQPGDSGMSSTFMRVFLMIENESAIPITGMQVYCENISVTSDQPAVGRAEDYRRVILGGSAFPLDLSPREKCHVGILREIVDLTSMGTVKHKWIELHIPLKCVSERVLYGREFSIDVIVHAKEETVPRPASYVFGWRDDQFFFAEVGQS